MSRRKRRKKVSGWCIVTDTGARTAYLYDSRPDVRSLMPRERAVRMVEAIPRREAVVRAQAKVDRAATIAHAQFVLFGSMSTRAQERLSLATVALLKAKSAVEKLQRKGRKPS